MASKTPKEDPALAQTQVATPSDGVCAVGSSAVDRSTLADQMLDKDYLLGEEIGAGGMGQVFRATQLSTGRTVAVKVLSAQFGKTPAQDVRKRFLAEVWTTAALNHPGIVTIYDAGETDDGIPYLVMEYLQGQDLADVLNDLGDGERLPDARAVSILLQIADALGAAHERGVIHRDLKPENIVLVRASGGAELVKIVDFGVAKATAELFGGQRLTLDGEALGTPKYMSPEQARGEEVDGRCDIYALGEIAYELLTGGRLPHDAAVGPGATPIKVLHVKGDNTSPTPVTEYRKDLPPALAAVVMWALQNDADGRPQTMAQLAHELRAAMEAPPAKRSLTKEKAMPRRKPAPIRSGESQSGRPFPIFWVGFAVAAALAVVVGVMIAQSGKPAPVRSGELQSGREPETATAPAVVAPAKPVSRSAAVPTPPPMATVQQDKSATSALQASKPRPAERPVSVKRVRETRRRDDGRKAKIVALQQEAQNSKVALRRNPRNRELRARLNRVCRELTELGETIPECQ